MNDNDIIKALECCKNLCCSECPKNTNLFLTDCDVQLCQEAIDLINRQKAEIERLKDYNENLQTANTALSNEILDIKSEAIKEFAEEFERRCIQGGIYPAFIKATLNNLVKEYKQNDRA